MRYYVVRNGRNFEQEKAAHGNNFFTDLQMAIDWGKLFLDPGQKFWVCDENGGVFAIITVPMIVGHA